jgi:hypothetical protein
MQQRSAGHVEPDHRSHDATGDPSRSKRELAHEAAQAKIARATVDLALERLQPRLAVIVANAALRDQLDRLHDHEARKRLR